MNNLSHTEIEPALAKPSPWRIIGWICAGVIALSVVACLVLSAIQSVAVTDITVTALDPDTEPRDHNVPFVKQHDALPDYDLQLILRHGDSLRLGTKPNSSAGDGLTWHLHTPVSVAHISTIRLQEKDKIVSDPVAEVGFSTDSITENGYRFDIATQRSFSTGVQAFFELPIGKAIATGFLLAVFILILSAFTA